MRIFLILLIIISFTYITFSKTVPKINGFKDKKAIIYTPEEGVYVDVDHSNIFYDKKNFQQEMHRTKKAGKLEAIDSLSYSFETKQTLSRLEVEYNLPSVPEITHGDYDNFQFFEIQVDGVSIGKCVLHRRLRNYNWPQKIFSTFCLGEMYNVQKGKHKVTLKVRGMNYHLYIGYYDTPPSVTLVGEFMKQEDKKAFIIPKIEKTVRVRSLPTYVTSNTRTDYIVFPNKSWWHQRMDTGWRNKVENTAKFDLKFLPSGKISIVSYHQASISKKRPNMTMLSGGYYDENNVFRILETDADYWNCGKKLWNDSMAYINNKFKDWSASKNKSVANPRNIYNKSQAIGDKMGSNRYFYCNRSIDAESYYKLSTIYVEPFGDGTVEYIKVNKQKVDLDDKVRQGLIQVTGDNLDNALKPKDVIEFRINNSKAKLNMMMAAVFYKGKDGNTKEINSDQYLKCDGADTKLKEPKISDKDTKKKQQYDKYGYFSNLYPYIKYYIGKSTSVLTCKITLPDI